MTDKTMKILIIGGGFFGMYLAEHYALKGCDVTIFELEDKFMGRASFYNQARVHAGYHYPRSILTALRSQLSRSKFEAEFTEAIASDFEKYYLVGKPLGKVSAAQFSAFSKRIGAKCETASGRISSLVNPRFIEASYSTTEYAFNADILRKIMERRLENAGVHIQLSCQATEVFQHSGRLVLKTKEINEQVNEIEADHIFNCTYANLNYLHKNSQIDVIPLKHEMTEACMVQMPDEISDLGITVMCGPFFSVMPFPPLSLHSFTHVRYTPHYAWWDNDKEALRNQKNHLERPPESAWSLMQKDAARYIPILNECVYKKSHWETKTLLPKSEVDDSRPILFKPDHGLPGMHSVLGGKIDNVYEMISAIDAYGII